MPTYMPPDAAIQALMTRTPGTGDAGIEQEDPTSGFGAPTMMTDQGTPLIRPLGPFAFQPPVDYGMQHFPWSAPSSPSNQTPMVEALMRGS